MKINQKTRLSFFSELYENAKNHIAPIHEKMDEYMAQYMGSDRIDGSSVPAAIVRNITYELIEAEVSSEIPAPRVAPELYSEKNDRNARSVERLCLSLRDKLPFEEMNDKDERYTYIYGGSVFFAEWDDAAENGLTRGGVRVSCLSPKSLVPEPYVTDIDDMEYCFLRFDTTRDELCRRYGVTEETAALASPEVDAGGMEEDDLVTVVVCFYKNERGEVSEYVFSGDAELLSLDDYYSRRGDVCLGCGDTRDGCRCESPRFKRRSIKAEHPKKDILLTDGRIIPKMSPLVDNFGEIVRKNGEAVMTETELPYYRPKHFPIVVRRNVSKENALFGESDCAVIRPQQQAVNKIESRIMQKLLRAGITPVLPDDAEVTLTNAVFGEVIRTKPGESVASYGVLDTTPAIRDDILEAERLYLQAKNILGISDTYLGQEDATAISGKAKEILIRQASGRLLSKRRMKNAAYARIDRIVFEMYLAYADTALPIPLEDALGARQNGYFYRYDFLDYGLSTGSYRYNDAYLFATDPATAEEYDREKTWQRNLENLRAGTLGDPQSAETLLRYWLLQAKAHYPNAQSTAEYFRALLKEKEAVV